MAYANKTFRYAIFNQAGNYLTDWTDVISDPDFQWPINNGVAELIVRLARPFNNFGEGYDVWFENMLQLYAFDKEAPKGVLIYSGRLNEYRPQFTKDTGSAYVDVQFLGYASQLADQVTRYRQTVDFEQIDASIGSLQLPYQSAPTGQLGTLAMNFQLTVDNCSGFALPLSSILSTHPPITVGLMYADNNPTVIGNATNYIQPGVVIASGVIPANSIPQGIYTPTTVNFTNTVYNLNLSNNYFAFVSGSGVNVYLGNGLIGSADVWGAQGGAQNRTGFQDYGGTPTFFNDLQIASLFDTTAPNYVNIDPTAMVQDLINNRVVSDVLTFNPASRPTGTSVSYQFNMQTYKDALDLAIELSPPYFYYRIGPDNSVLFTQRDDATINHILRIGFEIVEAQPIKSVNDTLTRIIFYGGSQVAKAELNFADDRYNMQPQYTLKEKVERDARVLYSASALLLTRDTLDDYGNPTVEMTITVADSNGDYKYGYDIESFLPGQRVLVVDPLADSYKNLAGTWDNANWDGDVWDYSDYNLLSTPLQIQNIEYKTDLAILTLSNFNSTAAQKIRDDTNNLQQVTTANSPGA